MHPRRSIAAALLALSLAAQAGAQPAGTVLAELNFNQDQVDAAPKTKLSLDQDDKNKFTVVKELGPLKDQPLKVEKTGETNGRPTLTLAIGQPASGIVRFEWDAAITQYVEGPKFPGAEPLLGFNLCDGDGRVFLSLRQVVGGGDGGPLHALGLAGDLGKWAMNQANHFQLDYDVAKKTASLTVNGKAVAKDCQLNPLGPLSYCQFRDGTGFGAQDGHFVAALDNIKVTALPSPKH